MKLEGQQQPQMNIDIMKDTKPIVCGAKKVDIEKFKMLYFEWKNKLWGDSKGFIIKEDKWEEYDTN